jgi:hypothetical protein
MLSDGSGSCPAWRVAMQLGEGREPFGQAADDRERNRQPENPRAERRLGSSADGDRDRDALLHGAWIHAEFPDGRSMLPFPRDPLGLAEIHQQHEPLGEQLVVIARSKPNSGTDSTNEPRPAMISTLPPESRSSAAKSWKTRTWSSELSTVTALVSRMRSVRSAAAARTTAGARHREVRPMVLPHPEDIERDRIRELDLLHQVAEPLHGMDHAIHPGVE